MLICKAMKVKSKPDGCSARRRAIQKVREQFYFLFSPSNSERAVPRGPLWGIVVAFFLLVQSCEQKKETPMLRSQQLYTPEVPAVTNLGEAGSLLFYTENTAQTTFSHDYLRGGYQHDLYLRNLISNAGSQHDVRSSAHAVSENTIQD
jgi:hypothetical protein